MGITQMPMQYADIAFRRLLSQQLLKPRCKTAVELVAAMGAVQGQEYGPTKWGLGLRLSHLKDADIEKDLVEGRILRTHLLRPTWHFVTAQDIRWLLELTGPRVLAVNLSIGRKIGLDDAALLRRTHQVMEKVLGGGKALTREEINAGFKDAGMEFEGLRLTYVMMEAELTGLICSGPKKGNQFTYMLLEERVPPVSRITRDEALAEITLRYYGCRGPATVKDFGTWSGLTLADCRKGIAMVGTKLLREEVDGKEYYFMDVGRARPVASRRMFLLPIYDELIMGYQDRGPNLITRNSLPGPPNVAFDNLIVWDGQVIGSWKRVIERKAVRLGWKFFQELDAEQLKWLDAAVERYSEFMGMEVIRPQ
jgi:hypothetical protein